MKMIKIILIIFLYTIIFTFFLQSQDKDTKGVVGQVYKKTTIEIRSGILVGNNLKPGPYTGITLRPNVKRGLHLQGEVNYWHTKEKGYQGYREEEKIIISIIWSNINVIEANAMIAYKYRLYIISNNFHAGLGLSKIYSRHEDDGSINFIIGHSSAIFLSDHTALSLNIRRQVSSNLNPGGGIGYSYWVFGIGILLHF